MPTPQRLYEYGGMPRGIGDEVLSFSHVKRGCCV
jgi:hypothetical protein